MAAGSATVLDMPRPTPTGKALHRCAWPIGHITDSPLTNRTPRATLPTGAGSDDGRRR